MIVVDTNVVSALMRDNPGPVVSDWLDRMSPDPVWLTAISAFELRSGTGILEPGRPLRQLEGDLALVLEVGFPNRVLPFDDAAAAAAGSIAAGRKRRGRPLELRDTMIAGVVVSCRAQFATRHRRRFDDLDVPLIDPWTTPSPP